MKRQNIEYPDLTKLTDSELIHEVNYYRDRIPQILDQVYNLSENICGSVSIPDSIPSRKLISDLHFSVDRVEAVKNEINYRAEMMR